MHNNSFRQRNVYLNNIKLIFNISEEHIIISNLVQLIISRPNFEFFLSNARAQGIKDVEYFSP
jgi:hypothetical protein